MFSSGTGLQLGHLSLPDVFHGIGCLIKCLTPWVHQNGGGFPSEAERIVVPCRGDVQIYQARDRTPQGPSAFRHVQIS